MKIVEFLTARIAEDESRANGAWMYPSVPTQTTEGDWIVGMLFHSDPAWVDMTLERTPGDTRTVKVSINEVQEKYGTRIPNKRALAEAEAKRAIIALCLEWPEKHEGWDKFPWYGAGNDILFTLASIYADHPDYLEEWAHRG